MYVTKVGFLEGTAGNVEHAGSSQELTIVSIDVFQGWVKAVKKHKDVCFLDVTDGLSAGHIQLVVPSSKLPQ